MIHPLTGKPLSLRISVTDLCTARCRYCLEPEGVQKLPCGDVLRIEEIVRFVDVTAGHFGLVKVHLTGGEPLVRNGIVDLVAMLAARALPDLALTTNAQRLPALAGPLKAAGLQRVNVSLDTLDAATYTDLTRGGNLRKSLDGLDAALACGLAPVKINVTVLRGWNLNEVVSLATFAFQRGCEIRFLELMPIGPAADHFDAWFVPSSEVRAALAEEMDLTDLPPLPGSSARRVSAHTADFRGTVGFISPCSEPFCVDCRRLRLTATGELIGCLGLGNVVPIRELLAPDRTGELVAAVEATQCGKRNGQTFTTPNLMTRTGG